MVKATEANFGGSLAGYLTVSYAELVAALGEPNAPHDGYKTDAEWAVQLDDGRKASIYNYQDGVSYKGADGTPTEEITNWHVGAPGGRLNESLPADLDREIRAALAAKAEG